MPLWMLSLMLPPLLRSMPLPLLLEGEGGAARHPNARHFPLP